jgi:hypothetical protein
VRRPQRRSTGETAEKPQKIPAVGGYERERGERARICTMNANTRNEFSDADTTLDLALANSGAQPVNYIDLNLTLPGSLSFNVTSSSDNAAVVADPEPRLEDSV